MWEVMKKNWSDKRKGSDFNDKWGWNGRIKMNDCFIMWLKGNVKKRGTKPQSVVPPFYIVL